MKYILIAILMMLSPVIRAEGGKSSPLTISSSSIVDGETNVETRREIKFVFSKNISNLTVKETNLACFSLTDSSGATVPIKTILFDDQLERDKRNEVIIVPEALQSAEQYTLTISADLTAKNGASPVADITFSFSTPGFKSRSPFPPALKITAVMLIGVAFGVFMKRRHV